MILDMNNSIMQSILLLFCRMQPSLSGLAIVYIAYNIDTSMCRMHEIPLHDAYMHNSNMDNINTMGYCAHVPFNLFHSLNYYTHTHTHSQYGHIGQEKENSYRSCISSQIVKMQAYKYSITYECCASKAGHDLFQRICPILLLLLLVLFKQI